MTVWVWVGGWVGGGGGHAALGSYVGMGWDGAGMRWDVDGVASCGWDGVDRMRYGWGGMWMRCGWDGVM